MTEADKIAHFEKIAKLMRGANVAATVGTDGWFETPHIIIDDHTPERYVLTSMRFREEDAYLGFMRKKREPRKWRISLDGYDWRPRGGYRCPGKSYPQKKDGTYSYDAIARQLLEYIAYRTARAKRESVVDSNRAVVLRMRQNLPAPLQHLVSFSPTDDSEHPVKVEIAVPLPEEKARALINAVSKVV